MVEIYIYENLEIDFFIFKSKCFLFKKSIDKMKIKMYNKNIKNKEKRGNQNE
jgi:hypothetical protein